MEEEHCYCAICGVPCGQVTDEISDEEYSYSPDILELDDIYWMSDVKLLTVNRKTGRTVTCNEPEHEGGREFSHWSESRLLTHPDNFGRGVIEVYRITEDRPPVIPLHLSCLKLLEKASKTKINLRVLHAALSKRCVPKHGMDPVALNYDYGQANKFQRGGHWRVEKWSESVVMDPTEVDGTIVNGMLDEVTRDSSTEASPEDDYWKSNLYGNHGWFTMFLPSETQLKKRCIDWRRLHFLTQDLGNGRGRHGHTKARLQFRNRARVWRVFSSILKDYKVAFEEDKLKPKILSKRQIKVEAFKRRAEIRAMERQNEINLMESLSQLHPFESQEGVNLLESQVWLSPMEKERLISSSTVQSKISQFFIRPH